MNKKDLIQALVDDCRTSQTKVEDFMKAFGDIFADALGRGEYVNVPGLGQFSIYGRMNGVVQFRADADLRARFKLRPPKIAAVENGAPICPKCEKRPRKILNECATCNMRKYRKAKGAKS